MCEHLFKNVFSLMKPRLTRFGDSDKIERGFEGFLFIDPLRDRVPDRQAPSNKKIDV